MVLSAFCHGVVCILSWCCLHLVLVLSAFVHSAVCIWSWLCPCLVMALFNCILSLCFPCCRYLIITCYPLLAFVSSMFAIVLFEFGQCPFSLYWFIFIVLRIAVALRMSFTNTPKNLYVLMHLLKSKCVSYICII